MRNGMLHGSPSMQTGGGNSHQRCAAAAAALSCWRQGAGAPHQSHAVSHGTRERGLPNIQCNSAAMCTPCAPHVHPRSVASLQRHGRRKPSHGSERSARARSQLPVVHARPNRACATCPARVVTGRRAGQERSFDGESRAVDGISKRQRAPSGGRM